MSWKYPQYEGKRYKFEVGDYAIIKYQTFTFEKHRCLARVKRLADQNILVYTLNTICPSHPNRVVALYETALEHP